jgi:hypothetical protein
VADRFDFNPKKSGPDHAVPVIFLAIAESERCRRRDQCEASSSGWTAALYRRAGRRVGEAGGADWRCLADREHQRAGQGDDADADLPCGTEGTWPNADGVPDHRRLLRRRAPCDGS